MLNYAETIAVIRQLNELEKLEEIGQATLPQMWFVTSRLILKHSLQESVSTCGMINDHQCYDLNDINRKVQL